MAVLLLLMLKLLVMPVSFSITRECSDTFATWVIRSVSQRPGPAGREPGPVVVAFASSIRPVVWEEPDRSVVWEEPEDLCFLNSLAAC